MVLIVNSCERKLGSKPHTRRVGKLAFCESLIKVGRNQADIDEMTYY